VACTIDDIVTIVTHHGEETRRPAQAFTSSSDQTIPNPTQPRPTATPQYLIASHHEQEQQQQQQQQQNATASRKQ
jgi:hypothetical protein